MAILIIEQIGAKKAGVLRGRVLIGRWPANTLVIDNRAVSRVHAWFGVHNGDYYISDAGSRTGTFVNGTILRARHVLAAGDRIKIGPALLSFRMEALPVDVEEIDLGPQRAATLSSAMGKFMECRCGAPLWLPHGYDGRPRCRNCGRSVKRLLKKLAEKNTPVNEPPAILSLDSGRMCGICHSPIAAFDAQTDCASCGLPFHAECWEVNHGCSAYGCDKVGVLDRLSDANMKTALAAPTGVHV